MKILPPSSKPPFFCVHAHGGNVVGYYDLSRHLGPDQPFYGIQAEGLDGKPIEVRQIPDMASGYIRGIRGMQPDGPYFLGGWCMGGVIAFEMAQQLRSCGEKVALLAMIDSGHPDYPKFLRSTTLLHRLAFRLISRMDYEISNLREVGSKEKLAHIRKKTGTLLEIMQVKGEKMSESLLPKFPFNIPHSHVYLLNALKEAHLEAYKNYKPTAYKGSVTIFRATKQPLGIYPDPTLGWGDLIKGELELHEIPGHHLSLLVEPSVRVVAGKLRACLEKARRETN